MLGHNEFKNVNTAQQDGNQGKDIAKYFDDDWHHVGWELENYLVSGMSSSLAVSEEPAGLILGLRPANERRRYKVMPSLIGWVQTQNQPWASIDWVTSSCRH